MLQNYIIMTHLKYGPLQPDLSNKMTISPKGGKDCELVIFPI